MNKERIKQYKAIKCALTQIRKDIEEYTKKAETPGKLMSDIAKGSSAEFPYLPTRMKIESYDNTRQTKYIKKLKRRKQEYENMIEEVEEWIDGIDDPLLYAIFRMKLRNNMTEEEIGRELGYSQQRINQLMRAALKED